MELFGLLIASFIIVRSLALPMGSQQRVETDPELTAGYFEGDMVLDNNRNGLRDEIYRWPNNTVYYKFFSELDEPHRNHIFRGMKLIEDVSCIRFKEATSETVNFVNITSLAGGCSSSVGYRNKGAQTYNLQMYDLDVGCYRLGTIVHEFLHTLGFRHMQCASNRDEYVRIAEENIKEGKSSNFKKYDVNEVDDFDEEYDYGSVLHYSAYAFSDNGEMTIIPLKEEEASGIMGQRRGMSKSDIKKLNLMYRCPVKI